jgi:branched-chain amino acid transport system substrate-binding protein
MFRIRPAAAAACTAAAVTLMLAAGCTGTGAGADADPDTVRIGWLSTLSGPYQQAGVDMRDGFMLYVELHGNQLGGRDVEVIQVDEGVDASTALPAAQRLVDQDQVTAIAGILNAASFGPVRDLLTEQQLPLVGANARPTALGPDDVEYVWTTSWLNPEAGQAIAPYVHEQVDGSVYAIGPDNQGGYDQVGGFVDAWRQLGGQLANPSGEATFVPLSESTDFLPYLTEIPDTGAAATYAFVAGAQAVDFVVQYAQSPAADIPLYGAFLTEGTVLDAQGDAALGIRNVLNYSPDLAHEANRTFVAEWSARHDRVPTVFAADSYDAAQVLDQAIAAIPAGEPVTGTRLNEAIAGLGQLDGPRGTWQFNPDTHAPVQKWYLREVARDGGQLSNVVIEDLATLGG